MVGAAGGTSEFDVIQKDSPYAVVFFGTVSGGLSAELTGGNFWQGAATGLSVSLLNHWTHRMSENDCPKCPIFKRLAKENGGNTDLEQYKDKAMSLKKWVRIYKNKTYNEIINEMPKSTGMPGGPKNRYVINPYDGNVMDMRHVMVVGFKYGRAIGHVVEYLQNLTDKTRPSAFTAQDWYSNDLGGRYWNYRFWSQGITGKSANFAQGFSNWLYYDNK